jgi:crotonobetainyl-CoA hydratase
VSTEFHKVERDGRLLIVTINRPERMNALHPPASFEIAQTINEFVADPDLWIAIITGAGDRAFCAGNDLRYQADGNKIEWSQTGFAGLTANYSLNKPVIAAVNGVAMGGGFELALACDLIIASDTARFALPEPKVGLVATGGGVFRLPRQIPVKQAMSIILTGRHVSAAEGKELGFVNEVVPQQEVLNAAKRWAAQILECAPLAIRASKECVYRGLDIPNLAAASSRDNYPSLKDQDQTADFIEGPRAFAEKRSPKWTGR